jgi:hypothetical protein
MCPAPRAGAARNRGIASQRVQNRYKKFFWIPSLNPPAIDRIARGIARITRQPIRIRIELRDAGDDRVRKNSCRRRRTTTIRRRSCRAHDGGRRLARDSPE